MITFDGHLPKIGIYSFDFGFFVRSQCRKYQNQEE